MVPESMMKLLRKKSYSPCIGQGEQGHVEHMAVSRIKAAVLPLRLPFG